MVLERKASKNGSERVCNPRHAASGGSKPLGALGGFRSAAIYWSFRKIFLDINLIG